MKKIGYLAGGAACLFFALIAAFACWLSFQQMQASSKWPSTKGKITVSKLVTPNPMKSNNKKAKVLYAYRVGAGTYSGSRIKYANTTGSAQHYQAALIAPYPVGADVDVFYDPANPKVAVLEPGGGIRGYLLVLPPLILTALGAFLNAAGLTMKPQKLSRSGNLGMLH